MADNGAPAKSALDEGLDLLDDQVELAALELQYEAGQGFRRFWAYAGAAALALSAFGLVQVALVQGLVALGLSVAAACLLLSVLYITVAGILVSQCGNRDHRVGTPFQASRDELRKNLKWIRQILS